MFSPTEIIFTVTNACNLNCPHCFVKKGTEKLKIEDALHLIESCRQSENCTIEKIGFTGGEPFLNLDFVLAVTKASVQNDFLFDQIITNADWWKTDADLENALSALYNAGYDGKIAVSWDKFHAQKEERIMHFIKTAQNIFGDDSVNIQTVIPYGKKKPDIPLKHIPKNVPVYELEQSFSSTGSESKNLWNSRKWFTEDYCEGPGNIFYVHSSGNIAPCCGFANENPELFIGTIKNSFQELLKNASENKMIELCFEKGLLNHKNELEKQGFKFPGKCSDICGFCDYIMQIKKIQS